MPIETVRTCSSDLPAFRLTAGMIFIDQHGPGNDSTRIWLKTYSRNPMNRACNGVRMRLFQFSGYCTLPHIV